MPVSRYPAFAGFRWIPFHVWKKMDGASHPIDGSAIEPHSGNHRLEGGTLGMSTQIPHPWMFATDRNSFYGGPDFT